MDSLRKCDLIKENLTLPNACDRLKTGQRGEHAKPATSVISVYDFTHLKIKERISSHPSSVVSLIATLSKRSHYLQLAKQIQYVQSFLHLCIAAAAKIQNR